MKFAPYTSGRLKQLKIGITSYSENKTSLEVVGSVSIGGSITGNITGNVNATSGLSTFTNLNVTGVSTFGGNVAIGTDNVTDPVGVGNTSVLAVGILTAYRLYSTVFGEFTGGSVVADNIVGSALSVSGISTLGFVKISSGIITAASGVVTYFGDGSGLTGVGATEDVKTNSLQVLGISTFTGDLDVNGNIIGDSATNISGINSVTATNFFGSLTGNVTGDLTGNADTATSSATVTDAAQPNITSLGSLTGLNVVGITTVGGDIKANGNIVGDNSTNITGIDGVTATTLAGTLQTAAQPNVTSIGTLTGLTVSGISTLGVTSTTNLETQTLNVTGVSTFANNVQLKDNVSLKFGDNKQIIATPGDLEVEASGSEDITLTVNASGGTASDIRLKTGSTEVLKVKGNGRVGIGTTNPTSKLHVVGDVLVSGATTFTGPIHTADIDVANLDVGQSMTLAGNITGGGTSNILGINSVTATNFFGNISGVGATFTNITGTLQTAAQPNITSLGTLGALTVSGNINANGNIVGDNATNISGINSVTATTYFGDGTKLTGISTSGDIFNQTGITTSIGTFNVSAGIATNIDSFAYASNNYKTAEYTIHFMNGSKTQAQKLLVMQDGATAFSNEFAVMSSSNLLISVGATVSGSNVLIQATPETGVSGVTTFRWRREVQD